MINKGLRRICTAALFGYHIHSALCHIEAKSFVNYYRSIAMGNEASQERMPHRSGSAASPGLLPLTKIKCNDFEIENLIFAGGGVKGFAYAGAVRVVEEIGLLRKIKRFTGVGTGAIVAALLAVGYDSYQMQMSLNDHLENIIQDDQEGYAYPFPRLIENFGWNDGELFKQWLDGLLEVRSTISKVTFQKLYRETGIELCIVVTNINKKCVEYFHPKTTPDILISDAVFTSLSIAGIFIPSKYKFGEESSTYCNGSLLCSYPIHSYDGWWLSLKNEDFIPLRIKTASDFLSIENAFKTRNDKSLGFVLIDKYLESEYDVFVDRLVRAGSNIPIPDTVLACRYKESLNERDLEEKKYQMLKHAYFKLIELAGTRKKDDLSIDDLVHGVLRDDSLSFEEQDCLFWEHCESLVNCAALLTNISTENHPLRGYAVRKLLHPQTIGLITNCNNAENVAINDLHMLFGTVSYIAQNASFEVKESDVDRTVGIMCGHVGSNDYNLADYDEAYLFQQGWNATVAYFQEILDRKQANIFRNENPKED